MDVIKSGGKFERNKAAKHIWVYIYMPLYVCVVVAENFIN